jgi:hypothetical protein
MISARYRGRVDVAVNGTYWAGAILGTLGALRHARAHDQVRACAAKRHLIAEARHAQCRHPAGLHPGHRVLGHEAPAGHGADLTGRGHEDQRIGLRRGSCSASRHARLCRESTSTPSTSKMAP